MIYFKHTTNKEELFYKLPKEFNRFSDKDILKYSLGATLYMPSTKNIAEKIINKSLTSLTSLVMCFEDSIDESDLENAEHNVLNTIKIIKRAVIENTLSITDVPLIFLRVRNIKQFIDFTKNLNTSDYEIITGFIFPKFDDNNAENYLKHLFMINEGLNEFCVYGMPIFETEKILFAETRKETLNILKTIMFPYKKYILNIRVGGTDFSSKFSLRRPDFLTLYDIKTVSNCLSDILNFFTRYNDEYTISAPVYEYYIKAGKNTGLNNQRNITSLVFTNEAETIHNTMIKEILLDRHNGFFGKTVIHPEQIRYFLAFQPVTKEEYDDALLINNYVKTGILKSTGENKMNEVSPHKNWAKKIIKRAEIFGVIYDRNSYEKLL
ncbi:MAG: HpcH/HpaI aldolase/citrate lyase family protein [Fusobacteriales bacterium]|jgi:citrate lyase beta subunit|nr:HpcH/HpaI aldolase/citrate lyase family protein [Fusobacteriales bacterium]